MAQSCCLPQTSPQTSIQTSIQTSTQTFPLFPPLVKAAQSGGGAA